MVVVGFNPGAGGATVVVALRRLIQPSLRDALVLCRDPWVETHGYNQTSLRDVRAMNIRDALLEEHSKEQREKIVAYVGDDPARFAELMNHLLGPVYRLSQRAAWPVSYCVQRHPHLITPYWSKLAGQLEREDAHVAVRRNVARLLQFVDIPKRYQGRIFDACYNLLGDVSQPIAVRCFSMTVAVSLAKGKPDLMNELKLLVTEHSGINSAGFRSRFRRHFR